MAARSSDRIVRRQRWSVWRRRVFLKPTRVHEAKGDLGVIQMEWLAVVV